MSKKTEIEQALNHCRHLLPAQATIEQFVHHNTLHCLEHLPFEQAVVEAGEIYGAQPYMKPDFYRTQLKKGRISKEHLEEELNYYLSRLSSESKQAPSTINRKDLYQALLDYRVDTLSSHQVHWLLQGQGEIKSFDKRLPDGLRQQILHDCKPMTEQKILTELWGTCEKKSAEIDFTQKKPCKLSHQEVLLKLTGVDLDAMINPLLIKLSAAFLDMGISSWSMPRRDEGFFHSVLHMKSQMKKRLPEWAAHLPLFINDIISKEQSPVQCISDCLDELGINDDALDDYFLKTALALKGWAGMFNYCEHKQNLSHCEPKLIEFMAIRFLFKKVAISHIVNRFSLRGKKLSDLSNELNQQSEKLEDRSHWPHAFKLFKISQFLGLTPRTIQCWSQEETGSFFKCLEEFNSIRQMEIWHRAYETFHRNEILNALSNTPSSDNKSRAKYQVFTCIDDREESLRRHLEEISPECETFGAAGFYGLDMNYQSLEDLHPVPLCPASVSPSTLIKEKALNSDQDKYKTWESRRQQSGRISKRFYKGSRSLGEAALLSPLSPLASFPFVARILSPYTKKKMRQELGKKLSPRPMTEVAFKKDKTNSNGYSLDEISNRVYGILRSSGIKEFSPLLLILGHGSSNMNNPHESAYNCGACAGGRGGANGRVFALMANDPEVRLKLKDMGMIIPEDCHFVGGYHDTASGVITYYDLELVPDSHTALMIELKKDLLQAQELDSHERCRRFESASLKLSPQKAFTHVQSRAENLAEPRPECGHATNSMCIVGPRQTTRNLFLDRRAFLVSYKQDDDAQGQILDGLLSAVVPVCAGINLEYFFSYVDNEVYGCGSKLPHNVSGMVGVMNGHASDLRTGLPWQMVEIHEPMRLLTIIESSEELMQQVLANNEVVRLHVENNWVQLALIDPISKAISVYRDGAFLPFTPSTRTPVAANSRSWYQSTRHSLPPAIIHPKKEVLT